MRHKERQRIRQLTNIRRSWQNTINIRHPTDQIIHCQRDKQVAKISLNEFLGVWVEFAPVHQHVRDDNGETFGRFCEVNVQSFSQTLQRSNSFQFYSIDMPIRGRVSGTT